MGFCSNINTVAPSTWDNDSLKKCIGSGVFCEAFNINLKYKI